MRAIYLSLICLILLAPVAVVAQTPPPINPRTTPNVNLGPAVTQQQVNTAAASGSLSRFNPGASVGTNGSGTSYNSVSFSGVGGAILSCANAGKFLVKQASNLFGKTNVGKKLEARYAASVGADGKVPVGDADAKKELEKQTQTEQCLNGVAYAMAKNSLAQITNKTLNWVATGFNGNPLYVRDTGSYLKSVGNQKIYDFLQKVPETDPIFGTALRSAITKQVTGKDDGLMNKIMDTPEGRAYQEFQNDFTFGGWDAFLNQKNNSVAAYFRASDELSRQINSAQQNTREELLQGNGFLSMKKCAEWGKSTDASGTTDKCIRFETVTPGSVIAQQVAQITNSPVKQLEYADKINEVLGSFFDRKLSQFFSEGLVALQNNGGSGTPGCVDNGGGLGCNVVINSDGSIGSSYDKSALGYQDTSSGAFDTEFDVSRPQQLRAILKTQYDYINQSRDAQTAMSYIIPTLGHLDYCLPGPNPTWSNGLSENFSALQDQLLQPDPEARSTVHNVLASIPVLGGLFGSGSKPAPLILAASRPALFDKVTDTQVAIQDQVFNGDNIANRSGDLGKFRTWISTLGLGAINTSDPKDGDPTFIRVYLEGALNSLANDYDKLFNQPTSFGTTITHGNVIAAFSALKPLDSPEQIDIENKVEEAIAESAELVNYNKSVTAFDQQYEQNIAQTMDAVRELNVIYNEVNMIVNGKGTRTSTDPASPNYEGAKKRYIRERAAAGRPVDMACLDSAYATNTTKIEGNAMIQPNGDKGLFKTALQSGTTIDPLVIQQSIQASNLFYDNL